MYRHDMNLVITAVILVITYKSLITANMITAATIFPISMSMCCCVLVPKLTLHNAGFPGLGNQLRKTDISYEESLGLHKMLSCTRIPAVCLKLAKYITASFLAT